jgi:hypothetical protein
MFGCKDNIRRDPLPQYIGWEGVEWIDVAYDMDKWRADVKAVMDNRVS